ncbi:hypothetical protein PG985_012874 [Apiospora marii]|uniref:Uncharacterized protein n=1 Tax=Apiospora marii TaxID=335849 RepID=A0ABR1RCC0_9PEZI
MPRSRSEPRQGENLAQQYGGYHTGRWISHLPASWIPFVQLARLSPPAGLCLVLFPHLFGLLNACILEPQPLGKVIRAFGLMATGSLFLSNAIHGWNDLIDAPIDKLVARTKHRPIVRGAVTPRAALLFTLSQALAAAAVLLLYLPDAAAKAAVPSIIFNFYYPWSKRHTHAAQLVLGVSLGWGVIVGTSAADGASAPWKGDSTFVPTACLFASSVLWTVVYDTIYAFQDIVDDQRVGLKSTAVLFQENTKYFLWVCLGAQIGLLSAHGYLLRSGAGYFVVAVGGCAAALGSMIARVDLKSPQSCWSWFRYGFWLAGGSITGGLLWQAWCEGAHVAGSQMMAD